MSDERLRELERLARAGDQDAMSALLAGVSRTGCPGHRPRWRCMTTDEVLMAEGLAGASFAPATSPKRIARQLGTQARRAPCPEITDKQRPVLLKLVVAYRRSIPEGVVALARAALASPAPAPGPAAPGPAGPLFDRVRGG